MTDVAWPARLRVRCASCLAEVGHPCKDVAPGTVHPVRAQDARLSVSSTYGKRLAPQFAGMGRDRLEEHAAQLEAQLTVTQARCTELLEEARQLRKAIQVLEEIRDRLRLEASAQELRANEAEAQRDAFGQKALALQQQIGLNIILPGWTCECGAFNGSAKVEHLQCRACEKPKPR